MGNPAPPGAAGAPACQLPISSRPWELWTPFAGARVDSLSLVSSTGISGGRLRGGRAIQKMTCHSPQLPHSTAGVNAALGFHSQLLLVLVGPCLPACLLSQDPTPPPPPERELYTEPTHFEGLTPCLSVGGVVKSRFSEGEVNGHEWTTEGKVGRSWGCPPFEWARLSGRHILC